MNTNGCRANRFGSRNGYLPSSIIYQDGGVWLFRPKTVRNGVVLYGKVVSFNDGRKAYNVKKERIGAYQFNYVCTCLGNFLGHHLCSHIARLKLVEAATGKRR